MATQIEAATLRDWLEAHKPVTVVDIRTDDDFAPWAIPGGIHVNAYEALRDGQPGPLADLALPTDRPVVTVCNAGRGMSYVLSDVAVFTGDTLFTNGVGRPDLHANPDAARHRARDAPSGSGRAVHRR